MMPKKLANDLGGIIFNTRWLLYPMNLGLAVAGMVYVVKFLADDYHLIRTSFSIDTESLMVLLLGLVDMLMVANLVVMIYQGSHQIFIRKFAHENAEDRPQWLDHVDSGILKVKVASSVVGIVLIRLLKDFVNIEHMEWSVVVHRVVVLGASLASVLVMAVIWRLTHPSEPHE